MTLPLLTFSLLLFLFSLFLLFASLLLLLPPISMFPMSKTRSSPPSTTSSLTLKCPSKTSCTTTRSLTMSFLLWLFKNTYRDTFNLTFNRSLIHCLIEQVDWLVAWMVFQGAHVVARVVGGQRFNRKLTDMRHWQTFGPNPHLYPFFSTTHWIHLQPHHHHPHHHPPFQIHHEDKEVERVLKNSVWRRGGVGCQNGFVWSNLTCGGGCKGISFLVSSVMTHLILGLDFKVQNHIWISYLRLCFSKYDFIYLWKFNVF